MQSITIPELIKLLEMFIEVADNGEEEYAYRHMIRQIKTPGWLEQVMVLVRDQMIRKEQP